MIIIKYRDSDRATLANLGCARSDGGPLDQSLAEVLDQDFEEPALSLPRTHPADTRVALVNRWLQAIIVVFLGEFLVCHPIGVDNRRAVTLEFDVHLRRELACVSLTLGQFHDVAPFSDRIRECDASVYLAVADSLVAVFLAGHDVKQWVLLVPHLVPTFGLCREIDGNQFTP